MPVQLKSAVKKTFIFADRDQDIVICRNASIKCKTVEAIFIHLTAGRKYALKTPPPPSERKYTFLTTDW